MMSLRPSLQSCRALLMKLSPTQSLAGILEPVFAIRTEDDDRSMATPIRIQYLGATYHAVARDTHGKDIVNSNWRGHAPVVVSIWARPITRWPVTPTGRRFPRMIRTASEYWRCWAKPARRPALTPSFPVCINAPRNYKCKRGA